MSCFFVYEDWTLEPIPRCFYVGKGLDGRVRDIRRNKHHGNIVKTHGIRREVVLVTSSETIAFEHEIELIAHHKTFVHAHDYVWGANYTKGGDGTSGARSHRMVAQRETQRLAQLRRFANPAERKRQSEAIKKQWDDTDRRASQSARMKQVNPSHTHPDTPEVRERKASGQRQRYTNPEQRRLTSEKTVASCKRPEVFQRRSEAQKTRRFRERQK